ncbi:MAG: hypothetical protein FD119_4092 [Stygiobacter sp.]|jgi:hypothetical protein|nr:MAG: hypothetical protein FD119_4092 [Stygiobacter sp.]
MEINITDEEWEELSPENFETAALLRAVDAVDDLRNDLNDGEDGRPPQLRTDLLKLHQLAMAVINQGSRSQVADLFEFAVDLEDQVLGMMTALEQVQETLSQLTALYPESLSYADLDDAD